MVNHRDAIRPRLRRAAVLTLIAAALPLICLDVSIDAFLGAPAAQAQSIMRMPSLNIGPRIPTITPSAGARINPNIAGSVGRTGANITGPSIGVRVTTVVHTAPRIAVVLPRLPYLRYSHNSYPSCDYVNRAASGECIDGPVFIDDGGAGGPPKRSRNNAPRRNLQAAVNLRTIANEIIAEIDDGHADELARRHRLARIESQSFPLVGSTIGLFRITDGRPVETVRAELAADAGVRSVQPNFRYLLQDQKSALVPTEGDPAQYALAKLRLPQAHALARGNSVIVAVIDSGIDTGHPELAGTIVDSFDALGSREGPHVHGTGIAGAIVAHARLMGSAPLAKILAIRAFGMAPGGAESNSFLILKSLDYAASHGARIVNMSFAGPKDPVVERGVAAAAARGMVLVAASGNAGPKSPPLYPAANPNVIAVSATDAYDKLFPASNRGAHIAIAAPGVDIFLPAPDGKYQMTSGTSFSAAYISGLAALILERNPALKPEELRTILTKTARDLGAPGRDDLFGAGEADAYAAVSAVQAGSVPVATAPDRPEVPPVERKDSAEQPTPATRALNQPAATMASDKPAAQ
jgi:subtilisin family serine protease